MSGSERAGEIYPCGSIARVHTWPELCSCGYRTLQRRQGMKRGGKTSAESRCGASWLSRSRAREVEAEKKREKEGDGERGRLDVEISVTYARPEKISTPNKGSGCVRGTISNNAINDAFMFDPEHTYRKTYQFARI